MTQKTHRSYFVANLRISLGVEVRPGDEHAAAKRLPGLWQTLEKLPRHQWSTFARGDCGYGNEATMVEHEQRGLPYLFQMRHTTKVKEFVTEISKEIHLISAITERWSNEQKWTLLLTRLLRHWLGGKWLPGLPAAAKLLLSW